MAYPHHASRVAGNSHQLSEEALDLPAQRRELDRVLGVLIQPAGIHRVCCYGSNWRPFTRR